MRIVHHGLGVYFFRTALFPVLGKNYVEIESGLRLCTLSYKKGVKTWYYIESVDAGYHELLS